MNRVGVILGAISILSALILYLVEWGIDWPFVVIDWPFAVIGLILSITGYRRNKGQLAKIGIVLNATGLLMSIGYRVLRLLYILFAFGSTELLGMLTAIILTVAVIFYLSRRL